MNTLFISTFNETVIVGLLKDGSLILNKEISSNNNHSTNLVPTIEKVLDESNVKVNAINEIIVVNGPGSFTGVRIGVTVAKTLAYTLKAKIKTITSVEAVSLNDNISKKIVTVSDRKGKYYGIFENHKIIKDISYLSNSEFAELLKNYANYKMVDNEYIDIEKIYNYLKDKEGINPHLVNPIYIKKIEALQ